MPRVEGSLLTVPWTPGSWARGFAREQLDMIEFHRSSAEIQFLGTTNPFVSPAWSWPLIKRPMIYYSEPRTVAGVETIMAIGSPLVWWTALASFAVIGLRLTRRRTSDDVSLVAVVGFGFMYLPLLVVSGLRPATFLYYLLPSVPFMCLAAAAVVSAGRIVRSRYATAAFSLAAIALLAFFYPVLTGVPLPERGLAMRQWFHDCHAATAISPPTGWCWR